MVTNIQYKITDDVFVYRIDHTDTIVSISENWSAFAESNAWSGPIGPNEVVGHKLWDFIQDIETSHLYQQLLGRVRAGKLSRSIPFRCDSPSERRYLELSMEALPDDQIQFTSRILRTEHRDAVDLLDTDAPRSADLITLCSMCKKIEIAPGEWADIEEGLPHLKLFESDRMPQLTHGLCGSCYAAAMQELQSGT